MRVELPEPFVDERGSIQNVLSVVRTARKLGPGETGGTIGNVALIRSPRGAIRSNHYHKEDWHFLYMVSGRMLYFVRDVGMKSFPPGELVDEGQMVFTPVCREHAVLFLSDSVLLSMARDAQTHEKHEADVVRVSYLSREYADELLKVYP